MSRIGKKFIEVPSNIEFNYDASTRLLIVKGPNGQLQREIHSCVNINFENNQVDVTVNNPENKKERSIWGTTRQVIQNMVTGVTTGFTKSIELNGVGFKWEVTGENLVLNIGFSHPVIINVPPVLKLTIVKNLMTGTCLDKELIGDFFGRIHDMKPCDPYKQKGFKFPGRFYRKKVVKKTK